MAKGSPFATFLIIGPTCFFLGILFAYFPYDYYVLWAEPPLAEGVTATPALVERAREPFFALLEKHLLSVHASPPLIARILHIVMGTGLAGLVAKLYRPSEANMLFDGASLVLYMVGIVVYLSNIVKGLRVVSEGTYGDVSMLTPEEIAAAGETGREAVGREDSLRVLAASNTILALVLVGVLILQAGEWYAARKEEQEISEMDRVAEEKRRKRGEGGSGAQVPGVAGTDGAANSKKTK